MLYDVKTPLEALTMLPPDTRVVYGARTCWWNVPALTGVWYTVNNQPGGLPCDPRGGVLFECDDLKGFIEAARKNADAYGRHGLQAFEAAFHGNVVTKQGKPTCFETWDRYNDLIDAAIADG